MAPNLFDLNGKREWWWWERFSLNSRKFKKNLKSSK
jgi:hypothetical protein